MIDTWFWTWVILAAGLIVAEMFTQSFFKGAFGVGAAAAAALAYFGASPAVQMGVFIAIAIPLLFVARHFTLRPQESVGPPIAAERHLGQIGVVIHPIRPHIMGGQVRVGTEDWAAEGEDASTIVEGAEVEIIRVEGVRLIVRLRAV